MHVKLLLVDGHILFSEAINRIKNVGEIKNQFVMNLIPGISDKNRNKLFYDVVCHGIDSDSEDVDIPKIRLFRNVLPSTGGGVIKKFPPTVSSNYKHRVI